MQTQLAACLMVLGAAVPAMAQDDARMFVRGIGGVTFVSETGGVFGAGVGVRIQEHVQIVGEVGRVTNVLPRHLQEDLDTIARARGSAFGAPLTIDGQAPGVYGFGGLRVNVRAGRRATVFAEGGGGAAYGTSRIIAHAGATDVSADVTRELHVKSSETAALLTASGGVGFDLTSHLGVDVAYRFMRFFTDDPRINTGSTYVALRWAF